jgi:hypothetical protein
MWGNGGEFNTLITNQLTKSITPSEKNSANGAMHFWKVFRSETDTIYASAHSTSPSPFFGVGRGEANKIAVNKNQDYPTNA